MACGATPNASIRALMFDSLPSTEPGTLLAISSEFVFPSVATAPSWIPFTIDPPVQLPRGSYWLGNIATDATIQYYFDIVTNDARYGTADPYVQGAVFSEGGPDNRSISVYAEYLPD